MDSQNFITLVPAFPKMKLLRIGAVFSMITLSLCTFTEVIDTNNGLVQGILVNTPVGVTVKAFLGIPYAQPPIGNLRFKGPSPIVDRWPNVFLAYNGSKSCIQGFDRNAGGTLLERWFVPEEIDTSEDCLTLNVFAPLDAHNAAVMVWIHGGAFEIGSSTSYKYDGAIMAALGDVIVVSMNYRLNIFGFLYMGDNLKQEVPGNMGLLDQELALKWVRDNILAFGGDPDKVTIFGESAGAASVNHHLASASNSQRYFQRAIIQSGVSNSPWASTNIKSATTLAERVASLAGCSDNSMERDSNEVLQCFRKADPYELVKDTFGVPLMSVFEVKWAPLIDGDYISYDPETAIKVGRVGRDIDVMVGTTTDEGSTIAIYRKLLQIQEDAVFDQAMFQQLIPFFIGTNDSLASGLIQHFYTNWEHPSDPAQTRQEFINLLTDVFFHCKTNIMSDLLEANGNNVYRYQYSVHPSDSPYPKWSGSGHGEDISLTFGLPLDPARGFTYEEMKLSAKMIRYWTNFAKYGNPNVGDIQVPVEWPKYSTEDRKYLELGIPVKTKSGENLRYKECALWTDLLPKLLAAAANKQSANLRTTKS